MGLSSVLDEVLTTGRYLHERFSQWLATSHGGFSQWVATSHEESSQRVTTSHEGSWRKRLPILGACPSFAPLTRHKMATVAIYNPIYMDQAVYTLINVTITGPPS